MLRDRLLVDFDTEVCTRTESYDFARGSIDEPWLPVLPVSPTFVL